MTAKLFEDMLIDGKKSPIETFYPYELLDDPKGITYTPDLGDHPKEQSKLVSNYWLFSQHVSQATLEKILGSVLHKKKPVSMVSVRVLTPGYSGAHVLNVRYRKGRGKRSFILKMTQKRSSLAKEGKFADYVDDSDLSRADYVRANSSDIKKVLQWYILTYDEAIKQFALKDLLGKKISDLKKVYETLFEKLIFNFVKVAGDFEVIEKTNCWKTKKCETIY